MQLTQKERTLLQDQKRHEEVCIEKYSSYASQAQDPVLQQLFGQYASQEQQHHDTLTQLLSGQQPRLGGGQGGQQTHQPAPDQVSLASQQDGMLCTDMLMTEKYISGTDDTAIFEATNPAVRQALQHIQREEQQHGEGIFNYMNQRGLYQPK